MSFKSIEAAIAVLTGEACKAKRKRDCQLCSNPKAVGKYYLDETESENFGWWRTCSDCAKFVSQGGYEVHYYKYTAEYRDQSTKPQLPVHVMTCNHDWLKWSLVSVEDKKKDKIFDWMRCEVCHCYGKRFRLDQVQMEDLAMEIDLNCSH
ncbi:hypothetical protein AB6E94_19140 [Vibrio lentus]|uniref:hypothetical protein n=1 Tax=Vibrio TaxID=662 RepID=UPI000C83DB39|nr:MULTISPECIES: hypothetical protein [Vibrio]MCC4838090.1 hypothetical protein [Vibrio lentus]PMG17818.1 hypothetical protein BCU98_00365 [Vibrio splendidus]